MNRHSAESFADQHRRFQWAHPDRLVLSRVGSSYRMRGDDATIAAGALGLSLPRLTAGSPAVPELCIPVRTADDCAQTLIGLGFSLAIAEQVEAARSGRIILRAVVRLITPVLEVAGDRGPGGGLM